MRWVVGGVVGVAWFLSALCCPAFIFIKSHEESVGVNMQLHVSNKTTQQQQPQSIYNIFTWGIFSYNAFYLRCLHCTFNYCREICYLRRKIKLAGQGRRWMMPAAFSFAHSMSGHEICQGPGMGMGWNEMQALSCREWTEQMKERFNTNRLQSGGVDMLQRIYHTENVRSHITFIDFETAAAVVRLILFLPGLSTINNSKRWV